MKNLQRLGYLGLLAVTSALPSPARALSNLALTPSELAQNADLIVTGRVVSQSTHWNQAHTMIFTDVRFAIDPPVYATATSKSVATGELVLSFAGGTIGDTTALISDQQSWEQGRRYLLFTRDDGRTYADPIIGGSQGAFLLMTDEATGRELVLTRAGRPVLSIGQSELRTGQGPVAAIRAGVVVYEGGATPADFGRFVGAPSSGGSTESAASLGAPAAESAPVDLPGFVRVIQNDLLRANITGSRFMRDSDGSSGQGPLGEWPIREAVRRTSGKDPEQFDLSVPLYASDAGLSGPNDSSLGPLSTSATQGGPLGTCGFRALPLVMQQLPATSTWFNQNNGAMSTWNRFVDLYRYIPYDGSAGNNSQNEFAGWPSDSDVFRAYGFHWGGALGMTVSWWGCECCRITQSDVMFNPAYAWTTSISDAFHGNSILYMPAVMHELGHTLGFQTGGPFKETYDYDHPTVMHAYYDNIWEDGLGIHAADSYLVRHTYAAQRPALTLTDVGAETYYASGGLHPATLSNTRVTSGAPITVRGVTVENMSDSNVSNLSLKLFLSPLRSLAFGGWPMGGWNWPTFPPENYFSGTFSTVVPWDTPGNTYYVAASVSCSGPGTDGFTSNNVTWMPVTLEVDNPPPTASATAPLDLPLGQARTLSLTGGGFVPHVTQVRAGSDLRAAVTVASPTSLDAVFQVPPDAAWGRRDVLVTNPSPGGGATTLAAAVRVGQFVYPGDADHNGVVDEADVLPIGRYFGRTGAKREAASTNWASQALLAPWDNREAPFADCDGNGVVDANDVKAIVANWRRTPGSPVTGPADVAAACGALLSALDENSTDPAVREIRAVVMAMLPDGAVPHASFALEEATPNPSRTSASIPFVLPSRQAEVRMSVYSLQGQLVWERREQNLEPSRHTFVWDGMTKAGTPAAPGMYMVRLSAGPFQASKRIVRLP
jgi:hypothetical protein